MERWIPGIFQSPYFLENHVSISKYAFWQLNIWILNPTLWTFWLVENQLLNLSKFHTCSFHSTGMQFSCACSSSLSQKPCCHFFMMVATIDMELILLLRLQFFQHWGNFLWGDLQKQENEGLEFRLKNTLEYSICVYVCGVFIAGKKKFGSMFTSWSKHLKHWFIFNQTWMWRWTSEIKSSDTFAENWKKLAEFLLKRLSGAACDRITEEDSTWTLLVWILRRKHHQMLCFVVECLQPRCLIVA